MLRRASMIARSSALKVSAGGQVEEKVRGLMILVLCDLWPHVLRAPFTLIYTQIEYEMSTHLFGAESDHAWTSAS